MHSFANRLALLAGGLSFVHAAPAINPTSAGNSFIAAVCTAPASHFNKLELQVAGIFCSAYLHVKTATVSVTSTTTLPVVTPAAVTTTLSITSTESDTALTTVTSTTVTTLPDVTSTETAPVVTATSTVPLTITVATSTDTIHTTTTTTALGPNQKRAANNGIFSTYLPSVISSACSCLVTTPTVTKSFTATSTPSAAVAATVTKTNSVVVTTVISSTIQNTETDTVPGKTVDTTTTPPPTTAFVTSTATKDVVTTTTAVAVDTKKEHFKLVFGPQNGCFYNPNENNAHEADDGSCAADCLADPNCVAYTTAYYTPGGGTACVLQSTPYNPSELYCTPQTDEYQDYANTVVYNLIVDSDITT